MGDGIAPELISMIVTSITALIIIWFKSSMDNKASELREILSNINTNLTNININLISQSQHQNVVVKQHQQYLRPESRIIAENEPISVEEEIERD